MYSHFLLFFVLKTINTQVLAWEIVRKLFNDSLCSECNPWSPQLVMRNPGVSPSH